MIQLAIDPGPAGKPACGWVKTDQNMRVLACGQDDEKTLVAMIRTGSQERIALETVESYGKAVSTSVFSTCETIGRLTQAADDAGLPVIRVSRRDVKKALHLPMNAGDAQVRVKLLLMYKKTGGGSVPQIGTKSAPGPLFGVKGHSMAALGVAWAAMVASGVRFRSVP